MITKATIQNLGPIAEVQWQPGPAVNVIIGHNATGKTLLLKALWAMVRSREKWQRGDDPRGYSDVLADTLYWTFQAPKIGDIVRRGQGGELAIHVEERVGRVEVQSAVSWTKRAQTQPGSTTAPSAASAEDAIFVPAKEVISLMAIIKDAELGKKFGFGRPVVDLVHLLERPVTRGAPPFGQLRGQLEQIVGARLDDQDGKWALVSGRQRTPVTIASEGHKKLAIFDRLLLNRTLRKNSVVFIDEPESFLHPEALLQFLRILLRFGEGGVQVFMATHSLFVLNFLRLYAQEKQVSVSALNMLPQSVDSAAGIAGVSAAPRVDDLKDGMPDNAIVGTSVALYEMEMMGTMDV